MKQYYQWFSVKSRMFESVKVIIESMESSAIDRAHTINRTKRKNQSTSKRLPGSDNQLTEHPPTCTILQTSQAVSC